MVETKYIMALLAIAGIAGIMIYLATRPVAKVGIGDFYVNDLVSPI